MNKLSQINCPHFPLCSGCTQASAIPPILQETRSFFKERGIELSLHTGKSEEWRYRAKLAVRGTPQAPLIGLYQKGTHTPLSIPFCRVHHPLINQTVEALRAFMQKENISPYNEQTHQGELRYLQIVVERSSGKAQLTLVLNNANEEPWRRFWKDSLHSLWINHNTRRDNIIFGPTWKLLEGQPWLWEEIGGVSVAFHPASFAQANLDLFESLITSLHSQVPPDKTLLEYYAGVGAIGLSLTSKCRRVLCCEVNPQAQSCFELSKTRLTHPNRIEFHLGRAEENLSLLDQADLVLVDPPRKGLDRPLLETLKQGRPTHLFYISCGWDAFQRDCDALLGSWRINKAEAYALFPGTNQLELLVTFTR